MNKIQDEINLIDQRLTFWRVKIVSKVTAVVFFSGGEGRGMITFCKMTLDVTRNLWKCMGGGGGGGGPQIIFVLRQSPITYNCAQNPPPLFFCTPFC